MKQQRTKGYITLTTSVKNLQGSDNAKMAIQLQVTDDLRALLEKSSITEKRLQEMIDASLWHCRDHIQYLINTYNNLK